MQNRIVTYEQRVARMKKPGDEDQEIQRAKKYVRRLAVRMKKATDDNDRMALSYLHKEAELVLRKLRQNIFDLEEMLQEAES
jgi:hypothetical protein